MKKTGGLPLSRRICERVEAIKPSGIRRFFDLVLGRKDVISLGVGEPDFQVPWSVRDQMIYSLEKGWTSYTSNKGLEALRIAIADYYKKFGVETTEENVLITTGVSEGLDLAYRSILNAGDVVLVPEPCYVAYKPLAYLSYGEVISIPTTPDFKLDCDLLNDVAKRYDPKALIINYPNNPTGVTYNRKELEEIADMVIEHDMIVISDEIYAELTYSGKHVSIASLNGMEDRTIILNGFSKAYAMTGLRIGYAIAPEDVIGAMLKIHQYCMLCSPITAQIGALEALKLKEEELSSIRAEYIRRRNFFVKRLRRVLDVRMPDGAFYVFPSIEGMGLSSEEFAERLLMEKGVAVVPGNAFGDCGEGYIRCAYSVGMEKLKIAVERIEEFCSSL
jgi:aminotransferase